MSGGVARTVDSGDDLLRRHPLYGARIQGAQGDPQGHRHDLSGRSAAGLVDRCGERHACRWTSSPRSERAAEKTRARGFLPAARAARTGPTISIRPELSGGMIKRVAIARAIVLNPALPVLRRTQLGTRPADLDRHRQPNPRDHPGVRHHDDHQHPRHELRDGDRARKLSTSTTAVSGGRGRRTTSCMRTTAS